MIRRDLRCQQVQKYEKGANRVSASRLFQFSKILNVPPSYFFENVPTDPTAKAHSLRDERRTRIRSPTCSSTYAYSPARLRAIMQSSV